MSAKQKKPRLLIVDDEKNTREGLARFLKRSFEVSLAEDGESALAELNRSEVDIVLSDIRMPGLDGMSLLRRIQARDQQPVVILLTAYGSVEQAVEAVKVGAEDFLTKPVNLDHLELVLAKAMKNRSATDRITELEMQLDKKFGLEHIIGQSPAMEEVFETVRQVAPSRASVLIEGESGTGKELIARALHQLSPRSKNSFIDVHCRALSETLFESELFGHEKGAFTNAMSRKKGRFELADTGTLFLDEIGEIEEQTQVKLLRVLEERRFMRVGGTEQIEVDVRLVAATNRDLKQEVAKGDFREDLYYRLNVVRIELPPLRDRKGDVPILLMHFLKEFSQENEREVDGFSADAMAALNDYAWPGNIRELRNMVERMVVMTRNKRISLKDVPEEILQPTDNLHSADSAKAASAPTAFSEKTFSSGSSMEDTKKQLIARTLEACNGNRTEAAEKLGISRRTLHRKLNEYGLR